MALLISEDQNCITKLTLKPGKLFEQEQQKWQTVSVELISGSRQIETGPDEDVMLCREPADEVISLVESLEALLSRKRDEILFEPSEPSFELSFARTRRDGIKIEAWIDAGNGATAIYTWDAAGIRFYSTDEKIRSFVDELRRDFGL